MRMKYRLFWLIFLSLAGIGLFGAIAGCDDDDDDNDSSGDDDVADDDVADDDVADDDVADDDVADDDVTDDDVADDDVADDDVADDDVADDDDDDADIGVWGVSWSEAWPEENERATYSVGFTGNMVDLEARIEYGVEIDGETWDRMTIGTLEPGEAGGQIIFDRSTPWELRVKSTTIYTREVTSGYAIMEVYENPITFPLNIELNETVDVEGTYYLYLPGVVDPIQVDEHYSLKVTDLDRTIDLGFETLTGCIELEVTVGEEYPFTAVIVMHPEQNIVYFEAAPGVELAQMVSPWTPQ